MKQLIIDRAKWRTGGEGYHHTGIGDTQLLNDDGYMCCLGFYCLQAGIPSEKILNVGEPDDIINVREFYDKSEDISFLLLDRDHDDDSMINTDFVNTAIRINDKESITPDEREKMIKDHFKYMGIEVVYEGEYSNE